MIYLLTVLEMMSAFIFYNILFNHDFKKKLLIKILVSILLATIFYFLPFDKNSLIRISIFVVQGVILSFIDKKEVFISIIGISLSSLIVAITELIGGGLTFILVIGKVFYIQVIDYKKLNEYANKLWSRNLPIEADRGRITTSDKFIVADNLTTVSLVFIPNQIDKDKKEQIAKEIALILDCDVSVIRKYIFKSSSIERVHPEGRRLDYEKADAISKLGYEGVYLVKESKRFYPFNMLLCHSLGYVGIDNQGLSGLELQYDEYLTGAAGSIQYYSDAKGKKLEKAENYVEPTNGIDIELTINFKIQTAIERELDNAMEKYKADGAWALAMDPNNGEILGIASRPGFDPNNYQNYSTEEINRNLAIWSSYEPGSTFKIVTLATALEEGLVDLENEHFYDSGSINVEGARIKCWKSGGHGNQTFLQVVQNSCNLGVYTRTPISL